jgi:hypothetical protein
LTALFNFRMAIDGLSGANHVLEMFRRILPDCPTRTCLD